MPGYILAYFFVYQTELLMIGSPLMILKVFVASLLGIAAFAAGMSGFLVLKLTPFQRACLIAGGLFMVAKSFYSDVIGVALILLGTRVVLMTLYRTWSTRSEEKTGV